MSKGKNTVTYNLRQGKQVVYKGTTNKPEKRAEEHRDDGKKFTSLQVTSRRMTDEGAKRKEENELAQYRRNHDGKNPKYNKDSDG